MQVYLKAKHYQCDEFSGKGYDNQTIQKLLGHASVKTTMVYTHLSQKNLMGVKSPLDAI